MADTTAASLAALTELELISSKYAAGDNDPPSSIYPIKVSADQIQFVAGSRSSTSFCNSTMLISERPTLHYISTTHIDVLSAEDGLQFNANSADDALCVWPRGLGCELHALRPSRAQYTIAQKPSANPARCLNGFDTWRLEKIVSTEDDAPAAVLQNQEKIRQHSAHHFGAVENSDHFRRGLGPDDFSGEATQTTLISLQSKYAGHQYIRASLDLLDAIESAAHTSLIEDLSLFQSTPGISTGQDTHNLAKIDLASPAECAIDSFCMELIANCDAARRHLAAESHYFPPGIATALLSRPAPVEFLTISHDEDISLEADLPTEVTIGQEKNIGQQVPVRGNTSSTAINIDKALKDILTETAAEKVQYEQLLSAAGVEEEEVATVVDAMLHNTPTALSMDNGKFKAASSIEELIDTIDQDISLVPSNPQRERGSASWADTTPVDLSEYELLRPRLAMTHPFELDYFQKQAVMRLERRECVFVAAHTSAGKTVVAEYAIAMARNHLTRAIYTSPIKALSNQKYRDFKERFDDIGLITGDVSVNPDASCLIMTTEILRSMLYRGSDVIKDIEWVIFDEVHYVNDLERGVVWEEVIIMLPDRINLIFLSATTPNTIEFSDWIGRTKRKKVYVVSTTFRPVPLQHYLLHNEDIYPILGVDGKYNSTVIADVTKREKEKLKPKEKRPENVAMSNQRQMEKAAIAAQNRGGGPPKKNSAPPGKPASKPSGPGGGTAVGGGRAQWNSLLKLLLAGGREGNVNSSTQTIDFGTGFSSDLMVKKEKKQHIVPYDRLPQAMKDEMTKKEYERTEFNGTDGEDGGSITTGAGCLLPVVVFCFSKKKCEEIVDFYKGQDLLTAHEKFIVRAVKAEALGRLNPLDANLPQVLYIFDMLSRGFGVHHGGLLPILKESVEVLFSQSVVKVLIATETFAMGVNMPARSVVFHGIRKNDGRGFRDLLPGEYTQMAGRAGRRGLDKVGTVIIAAWTELPSEITLKTLITGTARKLVSQFRLSYNMILNLLRANDLNVEDMIKRSFSEFSMQRAVSNIDIRKALVKYEKLLSLINSRITEELMLLNARPVSSNTSDDMRVGLGALFEDVHESLRKSYELTQEFVKTSVRSYPINVGNAVNELAVPGYSAVLLANLGFAINKGRLLIIKHCGTVALCMALSEPVFLVKDVPTVTTSVTSGGSLSDIRRSLMASSTASIGTSTKETNDSKDKSENQYEFVMEEGYLYALVLVAPSETEIIAVTVEDKETLLVGECVVDDSTTVCYRIEKVKLSDITVVSNILEHPNFSLDPKTYHEESWNVSVSKLYHSVGRGVYHGGALHALDLQRALKRSDVDAAISQNHLDAAINFISSCGVKWLHNADFHRLNRLYGRADALNAKISNIKRLLSHENLSLFPDFQQRLAVLRLLGYLEGNLGEEIVTLKGRVACEMNTCDELLATEAIFGNLLEPLNPPEAAALLSAFIFQEKTDEGQQLTTRMEFAKKQLKEMSVNIDRIQEELGVEVFERNCGSNDKGSTSTKKPSGSLNFGLCAVVYEWARGTSFKDITSMSDVKEGSIVRCITRVDELCRDVRNAARALGNPSLYRKMEAASQCIKRDIVFAASLYVT